MAYLGRLETNRKLIICGSFIDLYKYSKTIPYGPNLNDKKIKLKDKSEDKDKIEDPQIWDSSLFRSKRVLENWVNTNAWFWKDKNGYTIVPKFATFTFAENLTNVSEANNYFMKFIKRLNYSVYTKISALKYATVIEFQKRGAVHYHSLFFNLPYIPRIYDFTNSLWKLGYLNIKAVDRVKNLSRYMTKYMKKSMQDERLIGRKRYFVSRGLYKPITIRNDSTVNSIIKILPSGLSIFKKSWESEFSGTVEFERFNLGKAA